MANEKEAVPISIRVATSSEYVYSLLPESLKRPQTAIVCGSGLGGLIDTIHPEPRYEITYGEIPYFPTSSVVGHAGKLVFGLIGRHKSPVMLLLGRAHYYEGHSIEAVTFATRVCKKLGVGNLILTNAAGGLNSSYTIGDIVIINDHLNMAGIGGLHPLRGPNDDDIGVRFPAMSDAYDLDFRRQAHRAWKELDFGRKLNEGIYAFAAGPSFETRAECRMLKMLGADLVGMSTVPEVTVARHSGMRVLAFSLVTNNAVMDPVPRGDDENVQSMSASELAKHLEKGKANHEEVLAAGKEAASRMQALVKHILENLS